MQNGLIFKSFIGVDVSKEKLDLFNSMTGKITQVSNSILGINSFIRGLTPSDELLVVVDLTGGYEALCVRAFYDAGFHVHRAEGKRVKGFSKAMNQSAKTDAMDAVMLARYGEKMQENFRLYEPSHNAIKAPVERLLELKDMLQVEKNRFQAPAQTKDTLKSIKRHIKFLEQEIEKLEVEIREFIKNDEVLSKKQEIMTQMVGIGELSSMILLAFLSELGELNRRQAAKLGGVAPRANDSGKTSGYRTTGGGGRPQVKKILFICALVAIRCCPKMKAYYERLCNAGKKKMVAIVAVMRKMLTILNLRIKESMEQCNSEKLRLQK